MLKPYVRAWEVSSGEFLPLSKVKLSLDARGRLSAKDCIISLGTGFKASGNTHIFDGDIVAPKEFPDWIGYVSYTNGKFLVYRGGKFEEGLTKMLQKAPGELKIIGTIYTNPELVSDL